MLMLEKKQCSGQSYTPVGGLFQSKVVVTTRRTGHPLWHCALPYRVVLHGLHHLVRQHVCFLASFAIERARNSATARRD